MKPHVRKAVAFIAAKAASGSGRSTIYDYDQSAHFHLSGTVVESRVTVFDHERGCRITGTLPSLFHHGDGHHIQLNLEDGKFRGFDYGSGEHFSGSINGN